MTFRSGPAAFGQQLKSSIQPGGQIGHREHAQPHCCQLDRQGNALEIALHQGFHRRFVLRGDGEAWYDSGRPFGE